MRNLLKNFENKTIDYTKLISYGFKKYNNSYYYEKNICNDSFKVVVELSNKNKFSKVIDICTNEEYVLVDISDVTGNFIGSVKEEYDKIINDIILNCTNYDYFKETQTINIIKYIKNKYNDDLEYLWDNSNSAIWRNKSSNKWYGLLMNINKNKLGEYSDELIDVINLKYQKNKVLDIIDNKSIFKGYHMNKNSWITIILDGSIDIEKVYKLIDNSYELTK